jgi:hypothetical protein
VGQPLLELNDVAPKANRSMLLNQLIAEQASEARLVALRDSKDAISFSKEASEADKQIRILQNIERAIIVV